MMKRAAEMRPVDGKVKEETENLFLKHNAVVIIGSEKGGQTSLAFQLLSSYDLSDGEENFLVITEPEESKYVRFGLKPVLIIKLMTGTEFDKGEACKWFRQFPVLYAAVRTNKAGVIFVTDGHVFQSWKSNMSPHPLLENVVYTDKESRDANREKGERISIDDTALEKLKERSRMMKQANTMLTTDGDVKEEARKKLIKDNAVVIVGPERSSAISLAFELLPSFNLSNGEENFLVLIEPNEVQCVKFGSKPVLIIELMIGTEFDKGEARKWFRQFSVLHAAVSENKAGVIFITDGDVLRMWQINMPHHPLLENVIYTDRESEDTQGEKVTTILSAPSTQSDQTSESGDTRSGSLRAIKSFRSYDIIGIRKTKFAIVDICVLPTREILLAGNNKMIKLDVSYAHISQCTFPSIVLGVCYTGNNEAVVSLDFHTRLQFVKFTGNMTLTRTIALDHSCRSLACHGNLLYVLANDSVHVYTTDGVYQRCLYTCSDNVPVRLHYSIAVSNDGGKVYIIDGGNDALITINSSGQHEYTLTGMGHSAVVSRSMCVDDQGNVYVIVNDKPYNNPRVVIKQVSSDGRHVVGTLFELEDRIISTMCFDKEKSALVLVDMSDKLKVLQFR